MLGAHLVPGYFAASISCRYWCDHWTTAQRRLLWAAALASTAIPDIDVIYNALFRGFINHSLLITHSLMPCLILFSVWVGLRRWRSADYLRMLVFLFMVGWLSHLLLDVIVHATPLFYPLSRVMIGFPPERVYRGGLWYYLTDPIFILEPLLFSAALVHYVWTNVQQSSVKKVMTIVIVFAFLLGIGIFLALLPHLQSLLPAIFVSSA